MGNKNLGSKSGKKGAESECIQDIIPEVVAEPYDHRDDHSPWHNHHAKISESFSSSGKPFAFAEPGKLTYLDGDEFTGWTVYGRDLSHAETPAEALIEVTSQKLKSLRKLPEDHMWECLKFELSTSHLVVVEYVGHELEVLSWSLDAREYLGLKRFPMAGVTLRGELLMLKYADRGSALGVFNLRIGQQVAEFTWCQYWQISRNYFYAPQPEGMFIYNRETHECSTKPELKGNLRDKEFLVSQDEQSIALCRSTTVSLYSFPDCTERASWSTTPAPQLAGLERDIAVLVSSAALRIVNACTGELLWKSPVSSIWPCVIDTGVIAVSGSTNGQHVMCLQTGHLLHRLKTEMFITQLSGQFMVVREKNFVTIYRCPEWNPDSHVNPCNKASHTEWR